MVEQNKPNYRLKEVEAETGDAEILETHSFARDLGITEDRTFCFWDSSDCSCDDKRKGCKCHTDCKCDDDCSRYESCSCAIASEHCHYN